ncbi:MAG: aminotransferase class V-fold PLP-dependent enzyme, partial [Amphritea sp.]|nr:aminotransferase class V-fold PLP-dependent enzyme [Amphritea sp.]
IADVLSIDNKVWDFGEQGAIDLAALEQQLSGDHGYSHVAVVHCETTTGRLNPIEQIAKIVKKTDTCLIVDAMSSFGGVPIDVAKLEIDFLISSANK